MTDPSQLPRVRCEFKPYAHGYNVLLEVRSVSNPTRAAQTIISPSHYLSERDLRRAVAKQAARLAVHLIDTVRDHLIDVDECARLSSDALDKAALELHSAELRRGA